MNEGRGEGSSHLAGFGTVQGSQEFGGTNGNIVVNGAEDSSSSGQTAVGKIDEESVIISLSDLESLRARNRYLERQNYLLQQLVDSKEDYRLDVSNIRTKSVYSSSVELEMPNNLSLPEKAIKKMLSKINDQKTLLQCRLLSRQWNRIIEDTSEVMRNITFPIWHPQLFLDLAIVKKGKVRSISFKNCTPLEFIYRWKFIDAISNTVEKVKFHFDANKFGDIGDKDKSQVLSQQQSLLVELILESCKNIQELKFKDAKLFLEISHTLKIASANQIKYFSVDIRGMTEQHANGFTTLFIKLPRLKEICFSPEYYHCNTFELLDSTSKIYSGLCDYIKSYKTALQLKKLTLPYKFVAEEHQRITFLLLYLCSSNSIIVLNELRDVNLNNLLELTDTEIEDVVSKEQYSRRGPMFSAEVNAQLTFEGPALKNLSRLNSLNIAKLNLIFKRDIVKGELEWLKTIRGFGLGTLILDTKSFTGTNNTRLDWNSIKEFENAMVSGLTSLQTLYILGDMFNSIRIFNWAQYFPNLEKLKIENCNITPSYLITDLTVLESLSYLKFISLPNLEDEAFTIQSVNRFPNDNKNGNEALPAIACFKSLKKLYISQCSLLTNSCVYDGIAKCKTLEKLKISYCDKMSRKCEKFVACEVGFTKECNSSESDYEYSDDSVSSDAEYM